MYNTIYKLIKVKEEKDELGEVKEAEDETAAEKDDWVNAPGNKMSMSEGLAKAIVEAVRNPIYV